MARAEEVPMSRLTRRLLALLVAAAPGLAGEFLVDGAWVEARIGHPELVILHAEKTPGSYDAGHVPGARRVTWKDVAVTRERLPNELPPYSQRRMLLIRLGIPSRGPIVVYGDGIGVAAGRLALLLDSLGLQERVRVLDGQWKGWVAQGRPVSRVGATYESGNYVGEQSPEVLVRAPEVVRMLEEGIQLIDARPRAQFTGEEPGGKVMRPGHIPGARSVPVKEILEEGEVPRLRTEDVLRQALGVEESGAPVVTYCRTGGAAAVHYLALRSLGTQPRFYDGSFIDWSRRPELPVER
jgi:thiosulfate/3-mercaptopyruvate sulfurtransferase